MTMFDFPLDHFCGTHWVEYQISSQSHDKNIFKDFDDFFVIQRWRPNYVHVRQSARSPCTTLRVDAKYQISTKYSKQFWRRRFFKILTRLRKTEMVAKTRPCWTIRSINLHYSTSRYYVPNFNPIWWECLEKKTFFKILMPFRKSKMAAKVRPCSTIRSVSLH